MVKIKLEKLTEQPFQTAIAKIDNNFGYSPRTLHHWNKLQKEFIRESTALEETRLSLVNKHAELDENGKPKLDTVKNVFIIPNLENYNKEFKELLAQETEINTRLFKFDEFLPANLTPAEVRAFEPFLEPIPEAE
jgi:hypothetical protein